MYDTDTEAQSEGGVCSLVPGGR